MRFYVWNWCQFDSAFLQDAKELLFPMLRFYSKLLQLERELTWIYAGDLPSNSSGSLSTEEILGLIDSPCRLDGFYAAFLGKEDS